MVRRAMQCHDDYYSTKSPLAGQKWDFERTTPAGHAFSSSDVIMDNRTCLGSHQQPSRGIPNDAHVVAGRGNSQ